MQEHTPVATYRKAFVTRRAFDRVKYMPGTDGHSVLGRKFFRDDKTTNNLLLHPLKRHHTIQLQGPRSDKAAKAPTSSCLN